MHSILIIFLKEMKEVLRDRKTLIFMIVLPTVIMPVLFQLMFSFMAKQEKKAQAEKIEIGIIGGELAPEMVALFKEQESFELVDGFTDKSQFKAAIQDGKIKLGLALPPETKEILDYGSQLTVDVYYNNASLTSKVIPRTQNVLNLFNDEIRRNRFNALGVSGATRQDGILEPSVLNKIGIADDRERWGEGFGGLLPYLLIIFCFVGALYPAIDIGAGEKERGTLETLLLTPVPRSYLVLGKFLVIFTTSITAAMLTVASMGVWVAVKAEEMLKFTLGEVLSAMSFIDYALMALTLVPLAMVIACVMLSISIYARNFKEAQSYAAPLQFVFIIPAVLAFLPGVELTWGWAMVPVTNTSLAIKELVKGTIDYRMLLVIFGSTLVFALAALGFCVKWFHREDVLFRG